MTDESSYPHSEPDLRTHPVSVDARGKVSGLRILAILFGVFIILILMAVMVTFFIPIDKRVGWVQSFEKDTLGHAVAESVFFNNRMREPMNFMFSNRNETFETSFQPKKDAWVNVRLRFAEPLSEAETFRLRLFDAATMMVTREKVYELEAGVTDKHLFVDFLPQKTLRFEVEHMSREEKGEVLPAQVYITADH